MKIELYEWESDTETKLPDIGANASAEEADEGVEDGAKQVIDVVDGFRLNFLGDEQSGTRAFGTKKDYLSQLKSMFGFCEIRSGHL